MSQAILSQTRQDALRGNLPMVADLLRSRRAGEIAEADLDDLESLSWIECAGGTLRLTLTGANICQQVLLARK